MNTTILLTCIGLAGAVLYLTLWRERNYWRNEAERLQTDAIKKARRVQRLTREVVDTQDELDRWEHQAGTLWQELRR